MVGISRFVQRVGCQERFGLTLLCFTLFLGWICVILNLKNLYEDVIDYIMNSSQYYNTSGENVYINHTFELQ